MATIRIQNLYFNLSEKNLKSKHAPAEQAVETLNFVDSEKATNFAKSPHHFCLQYIQTKLRWRSRKFLWLSQNI